MKKHNVITAVVCCAFLAAAAASSPAQSAPRVNGQTYQSAYASVILDRIREPYLANQISSSKLAAILKKQNSDGSWPDIPYDSRQRSSWEPIEHMTRIRHIAAAGYSLGWKGEKAAQYADAINRAFSFWYKRKPKSDNWWAWTIGVPQSQAPAMTMCADIVPQNMQRVIYDDLHQAGSGQETWTGTNRTWIAHNNLILALLTDNKALEQKALFALTEEIRVTADEGLQSDWSYHQHGPMLQTGNYGNSYLKTQTELVRLLAGTPLAVPPEKVRLLTNYVLEHAQWTVWGTYFDISAAGRQLDTPDVLASKTRNLTSTVKMLASLDPEKQQELEAAAARFETGSDAQLTRMPETERASSAGQTPAELSRTSAAGTLLGTKYWYRSDYLITRAQTWTASLKMHSSRVMRVETWVNDENKLGLFANDGALWFRVRGDEQENLQPLLDWRRIPGVTGIDTAEPVPVKPSQKEYDAINGRKDFVGGVTDRTEGCADGVLDGTDRAACGTLAAAAMDFSGIGVSAKKAWFFTPDAVICLGANIHGTGDSVQKNALPQSYFTAVNQTFRKGDILFQTGTSQPRALAEPEMSESAHTDAAEPAALWHDSIGYIFPENQRIKVISEKRTGSWKNLRTASKADKAEGIVMQVELLHTADTPQYEYAVVPGIDAQTFFSTYTANAAHTAQTARPANQTAAVRTVLTADAAHQTTVRPFPWTTLANTSDFQAVRYNPSSSVLAVIWKAGTYKAGDGIITADNPCLLIFKGKETKNLYISDPTQKLDTINIAVNGVPFTAALPRGGFAGSTIQVFSGK